MFPIWNSVFSEAHTLELVKRSPDKVLLKIVWKKYKAGFHERSAYNWKQDYFYTVLYYWDSITQFYPDVYIFLNKGDSILIICKKHHILLPSKQFCFNCKWEKWWKFWELNHCTKIMVILERSKAQPVKPTSGRLGCSTSSTMTVQVQ